MHEPRRIMGQTLTYVDTSAHFLKTIKIRSEEICQTKFPYALSGRPVHFHFNDARRYTQAQRDLQDCYELAGFSNVKFLNKPEAAALPLARCPQVRST